MLEFDPNIFYIVQDIVHKEWRQCGGSYHTHRSQHKHMFSFTAVHNVGLMSNDDKMAIHKAILPKLKEIVNVHQVSIGWTLSTARETGRQYDRLNVGISSDVHVDELANKANMKIDYTRATTFPAPRTIHCPYCESEALYSSTSSFLYSGRDYGPVYFCKCQPCGVYVGCHKGTSTPLGNLCDAGTRLLRQRCHSLFDPYWQVLSMNSSSKQKNVIRQQMYENLSKLTGIPKKDCHISMFDSEQCKLVIQKLEKGELNQFLSSLQVAKLAFYK